VPWKWSAQWKWPAQRWIRLAGFGLILVGIVCLVLSDKVVQGWSQATNRTGPPGVVAVVFEELAGLLDKVADARGGDLQ